MTYILGLTGGIASGKSTVCKMLEDNGAIAIYADKIVHELHAKGTEEYNKIVALAGKEILGDSGEIDRSKLSKKILREPEILNMLEYILHPPVRAKIEEYINQEKAKGTKLMVVEIPLMFRSPSRHLCDSIAVTMCSDRTRADRTFSRPGMCERKWLLMNSRQLPASELKKKADHIIDTECDKDDTERAVKELISSLV